MTLYKKFIWRKMGDPNSRGSFHKTFSKRVPWLVFILLGCLLNVFRIHPEQIPKVPVEVFKTPAEHEPVIYGVVHFLGAQ